MLRVLKELFVLLPSLRGVLSPHTALEGKLSSTLFELDPEVIQAGRVRPRPRPLPIVDGSVAVKDEDLLSPFILLPFRLFNKESAS